ncbi:hypothetical protein OP10G_1946 [Fimbriimonas ginsengisoli Gsoil 348]|uniref:Uncharacterized protein n=1 Tax=Fimbriimonas ginsengisoli Gsoil 348 TaxID=661478 RepID=A0A068NUM0_FIMGI|nr:hypothetical protein OP10G_1946 [Fimbriimonas ginsengisoli Gsoil 348]
MAMWSLLAILQLVHLYTDRRPCFLLPFVFFTFCAIFYGRKFMEP